MDMEKLLAGLFFEPICQASDVVPLYVLPVMLQLHVSLAVPVIVPELLPFAPEGVPVSVNPAVSPQEVEQMAHSSAIIKKRSLAVIRKSCYSGHKII